MIPQDRKTINPYDINEGRKARDEYYATLARLEEKWAAGEDGSVEREAFLLAEIAWQKMLAHAAREGTFAF